MTNEEFIMELCKCGKNDHICYKPYEYGRLVEWIPFKKAVDIIEENIKEFKEWGLLTDEQCIEAGRKLFKKHYFNMQEYNEKRRRGRKRK